MNAQKMPTIAVPMLTAIIPREDATALLCYGDGKNCEPGEMAGFVSTWKIFEMLYKKTIPFNLCEK